MTSTDRNRAGYRLDCAGKLLDLSSRPAIMGVVNLTPDSFFDGGRFTGATAATDLEKALDCALRMVDEGAEIIDVGGESTRPGAEAVGAEEEIERTARFIALLRSRSGVHISIDTWKAAVAEAALDAGANIVNDISGFTFDPAMAPLCGRRKCGAVLMHTPVRPGEMRWSHDTGGGEGNIVARVRSFLERSVGIARSHGVESIVTDPGIGFGKSVGENFLLLARLDELHALGCPVLAGLSRKSFLGQAIRREGREIPPPSERLDATTAANTIALLGGADILRVHDVAAARQSRSVVGALRDSCGGSA